MIIQSPANQRVKLLRSLASRSGRQREGAFLIEGTRLLEAALDAGAEPIVVLYDPALPERNPRAAALLDRLPESVRSALAPQLMELVSDTVTAQGLVAAVRRQPVQLPDAGLILVADAVADPGNVGTLLRAAAAAGAAAFAYLPGTADPFSPKVVRAAMGAHWQIPVVALSIEQLRLQASRGGWLAVARDGTRYDQVAWRPDGFLIVANEATGPRDTVAELPLEHVTIPVAAGVESLNTAIAAAVLLFEARRQTGAFERFPRSRQ